ncbi:MAG: hypothetical protein JNK85_05795 [Verrucomicrobiales bacterium]|nr:hypothetical protein [Verrucomicrobiales bacterium]
MIGSHPEFTRPRWTRSPWVRGLTMGLACGLPLLLAASGCGTPERRRALLSHFLDGVPNSRTNHAAVLAGTPHPPTNALSNRFLRTSSGEPPTSLVVSIHAPYGDRQCQECHSARFSHALRAPRDQLCQGCHAKTVAEGAFVHSPVRNGECLACHHPHTTESPHLLVKKAAELCLQCHDADLLSRVDGHQDAARSDCITCHDPHRGSREYLLRNLAGLTPAPKS